MPATSDVSKCSKQCERALDLRVTLGWKTGWFGALRVGPGRFATAVDIVNGRVRYGDWIVQLDVLNMLIAQVG